MYLRLGNVKIDEICSKLGIVMTQEDYEWFKKTQTNKVSESDHRVNYKIPTMTWHAFELPSLQIHAGSKKMAKELTARIMKYMNDGAFPKEGAKIGITSEVLEEEKFGYTEKTRMIDENLEVYAGIRNPDGVCPRVVFFVKTRETKSGNIFLQEMNSTVDPETRFKRESFYVPNLDEKGTDTVYKVDENGNYVKENDDYVKLGTTQKKEIRRKRNAENKYSMGDNYNPLEIELWNGNSIGLKLY